ncbi:hypothetical protein Tco_0329232 [Tanacetum coccineum]
MVIQTFNQRNLHTTAEQIQFLKWVRRSRYPLQIITGPVPQFIAPDHSSSGSVLHEMTSDQIRSDLTPNRQETSVDNISSDLVSNKQKASDYDIGEETKEKEGDGKMQDEVMKRGATKRHSVGNDLESLKASSGQEGTWRYRKSRAIICVRQDGLGLLRIPEIRVKGGVIVWEMYPMLSPWMYPKGPSFNKHFSETLEHVRIHISASPKALPRLGTVLALSAVLQQVRGGWDEGRYTLRGALRTGPANIWYHTSTTESEASSSRSAVRSTSTIGNKALDELGMVRTGRSSALNVWQEGGGDANAGDRGGGRGRLELSSMVRDKGGGSRVEDGLVEMLEAGGWLMGLCARLSCCTGVSAVASAVWGGDVWQHMLLGW